MGMAPGLYGLILVDSHENDAKLFVVSYHHS